jgi:hypothetical protein
MLRNVRYHETRDRPAILRYGLPPIAVAVATIITKRAGVRWAVTSSVIPRSSAKPHSLV